MTNRKSFIIHADSLEVLDDLTDEQAGQLFKAIKAYHKNETYTLNQLLKIAFTPFKTQFNRDGEKYKSVCKARAEAGSKGGKQKVANASKRKQKVANVADSDNKNDNDSDNKNEVYIPDWLPLEDWNDFKKMRKSIKKPMTERAETLAINELNKLINSGNDPSEVLQQSIMNNWKGLFELKGETNGRRKETIIDVTERIIAKRNAAYQQEPAGNE